RVRYRTLVRLAPGVSARAAATALDRPVADPAIRVAAYDESQPGLRRFFVQLATYLGLVGLASLLVGGVGIASSVAAVSRRPLGHLPIGVRGGGRALLLTYLLRRLAAGLVGSLAGAALGASVQPLLVQALVPF